MKQTLSVAKVIEVAKVKAVRSVSAEIKNSRSAKVGRKNTTSYAGTSSTLSRPGKTQQQYHWFKWLRRCLFYRQAGRWFILLVLLPWIASAVYLIYFASPRYVSEASFFIEKNDTAQAVINGFNLLGITPQAGNDQRILEAYIQSPNMLNKLQEQLDLRQHYTNQSDWLTRLKQDASYEDFLAYYRDHTAVHFDSESGLLHLDAQGFTPNFTQQLAQQILAQSEDFVNNISNALASEQLAFVQKEVVQAEQRLKQTTMKMLDFQSAHGLLSAAEQGAVVSGIVNELQVDLVRNRTELQTLQSYLNSNSSRVVAVKQRISALQSQLAQEKNQLATVEGAALNDLIAEQESLQLDLRLATEAYSATLLAQEKARTDASREIKQLIVVSSPQRAQDATYPRVAYNLTNIFLLLLVVFALIRMIRTTIREHRD